MMHGTNDNSKLWCGLYTDDVGGWTSDHNDVECIECLRVKIHDLQAVVDAARRLCGELVDDVNQQAPEHYFDVTYEDGVRDAVKQILRALDGEP